MFVRKNDTRTCPECRSLPQKKVKRQGFLIGEKRNQITANLYELSCDTHAILRAVYIGRLVYCEDVGNELGRVEHSGGKVLMPKTSIGENGFIAHFMDTEGNRIGLHSLK